MLRKIGWSLAVLGAALATAANAFVGWLLYDAYGRGRPLEAQGDFGIYMAALQLCGFAILASVLTAFGARAGLLRTDLGKAARRRRWIVAGLSAVNFLVGVAAILGAYWIPKLG